MVAGLTQATAGEHELVAFGPSGVRGRGLIREALAGLPVDVRLPLLPHVVRTAWSRSQRFPIERLVGELDAFHFSDWMYPPQPAGAAASSASATGGTRRSGGASARRPSTTSSRCAPPGSSSPRPERCTAAS